MTPPASISRFKTYFSAKYFTEETLNFLIEMINSAKNSEILTPNIDDFIHFLSEPIGQGIITEIILWIDRIYQNEEVLRKVLKKFIKYGLKNQIEFQLTYNLFKYPKVPRIIKICYERKFLNLIFTAN